MNTEQNEKTQSDSITEPRTAIVTGAGCSLGLGIPTMPDFMDTAFTRLAQGAAKNEHLMQILQALLAFTKRIKGSAATIDTRFLNVEELYGLAEMANDLGALSDGNGLEVEGGEKINGEQLKKYFNRMLMYVAIEAGSELIKNHEYERIADRIDQIKRESQSEDPGLFTDRGTRHTNLLAYLGLASFHDAENGAYPLIIQFNWDLAYDRALYAYFRTTFKKSNPNKEYKKYIEESRRLGWAHYLGGPDHDFSQHPLLLRPHGGLHLQTDKGDGNNASNRCIANNLFLHEEAIYDWLDAPTKTDWVDLPGENETTPAADELGKQLRWGDLMAIEPPTWKKDVTHFLSQWQSMVRYLRSVRRIIFIGYSMPRSDLYMRHFLALALADADYVPQITVWNPGMKPGTDTWNNYTETFAPLRRQERLHALPRKFGDPALFDLERAFHLAEKVPPT